MQRAQTSIKVSPIDHQALIALLQMLSGKIDEDQFRAVLATQSRHYAIQTAVLRGDKLVELTAEALLPKFQ